MTPYKAVFGNEPLNGLDVLNLPTEAYGSIKTARDLFKLLGGNQLTN